MDYGFWKLKENPFNNCKLLRKVDIVLNGCFDFNKHSLEGLLNLEILNIKFINMIGSVHRYVADYDMFFFEVVKSLKNLLEVKFIYIYDTFEPKMIFTNRLFRLRIQPNLNYDTIDLSNHRLKKVSLTIVNPVIIRKILDDLAHLEELTVDYIFGKNKENSLCLKIKKENHVFKLYEFKANYDTIFSLFQRSPFHLKSQLLDYLSDTIYNKFETRNSTILPDLSCLECLSLSHIVISKNIFLNLISLKKIALTRVTLVNFSMKEALSSLSILESLDICDFDAIKLDDGIFDNLKNLKSLKFKGKYVDINGKIIFSKLDKLEVLKLWCVNFGTEDYDSVFRGLVNLKTLSLRTSYSIDSFIIEKLLKNLKGLEDIELSYSCLTSLTRVFHGHSQLKHINLYRNKIEEINFEEISKIQNISALILEHNGIEILKNKKSFKILVNNRKVRLISDYLTEKSFVD